MDALWPCRPIPLGGIAIPCPATLENQGRMPHLPLKAGSEPPCVSRLPSRRATAATSASRLPIAHMVGRKKCAPRFGSLQLWNYKPLQYLLNRFLHPTQRTCDKGWPLGVVLSSELDGSPHSEGSH